MPATSYIVKCPSCGTANRIPATREGAQGYCGRCKTALLPLYGHPQPLTDRNFDHFIRSFPGPVLAEFWAPS